MTGLALTHDEATLISVSADSTLKVFDLAAHRQARSTRIAQLALSACQLTSSEKHVVVSSWDNHLCAPLFFL